MDAVGSGAAQAILACRTVVTPSGAAATDDVWTFVATVHTRLPRRSDYEDVPGTGGGNGRPGATRGRATAGRSAAEPHAGGAIARSPSRSPSDVSPLRAQGRRGHGVRGVRGR